MIVLHPLLLHPNADLQHEVQNLLEASQKPSTERLVDSKASSNDTLPPAMGVSEFAQVLKKMIELVESENDLTKYEEDIQQSLQHHGCNATVEIHCSTTSEGSESKCVEKLQLTCTLIEAKVAITVSKTCKKFSVVMAKIIDALHAHEGALERMKDCIDQMHLLEPSCRLTRIISASVREATTVRQLFHLLGKHWNCIDVDLLQSILQAADCNPALKLLAEFLEDRDCSLPIKDLIKEINKSSSTESKGRSDPNCIELKASVEVDSMNLEEYSEKKAAICGTLEVPLESLTLTQIESGSFILTWQMSAELVKHVQSVQVSDANLHFLARQYITEISIEGCYNLPIPSLNTWKGTSRLDDRVCDIHKPQASTVTMTAIQLWGVHKRVCVMLITTKYNIVL